MKRKCDSCIHSHVCEKHIQDVWNEFDDCRDYDAERPHGEWIYKDMKGQFCSICDKQSVWRFNFCPYCGADMRRREGDAE